MGRCLLLSYFRSKDTIKNYIMWRVVDKNIMSMPSQFVQAKLKFEETITGVREYKSWSYCLESMLEPMGMTLGRLYVDANFDESTKTTVRSVFIARVCKYEQGSDKSIVLTLVYCYAAVISLMEDTNKITKNYIFQVSKT